MVKNNIKNKIYKLLTIRNKTVLIKYKISISDKRLIIICSKTINKLYGCRKLKVIIISTIRAIVGAIEQKKPIIRKYTIFYKNRK